MFGIPFINNLGVALMNAGVLTSLLIGLLTNNATFGFLFLGAMLLGLALMFIIQARRESTDTSTESIPAMVYLALSGGAILLVWIGVAASGIRAVALGIYVLATLTFFITSIGSFYLAVRKRGSERRSNLGIGIAAFAWVAFYVVYNYSLDGLLKTSAEVALVAIMLLGVLLTASADHMNADTQTRQLDRPKADPLYAEQVKGDKVKQQS